MRKHMNHILHFHDTPEFKSVFIEELVYKLTQRTGYVITAPVYSKVSLNLFQVLPNLLPETDLSKLNFYTEEMFFKTADGKIFTYGCKDKYRLRRFKPRGKNQRTVGVEEGNIELSRVIALNSFGSGETLKLTGNISFNNCIDYSTGDIALDFSFIDCKGRPVELIGLVFYLSDA